MVGPGDLRSRVAHAWGYAEGHAQGPGLIRAFAARGVEEAKVVPAEEVLDWGPNPIIVDSGAVRSASSTGR